MLILGVSVDFTRTAAAMVDNQNREFFMKKRELPDVSNKNTKEQILADYSQTLGQINQKKMPIEMAQKSVEKRQLIEKVEKVSDESIIAELGIVKSKVINQLDALSGSLLVEFKKLIDIQAVIAFENQHLQEVYGIKELTMRSDQATKQVQDIACKALESSSQQYICQASEAA
jgi:hypothetical protein